MRIKCPECEGRGTVDMGMWTCPECHGQRKRELNADELLARLLDELADELPSERIVELRKKYGEP